MYINTSTSTSTSGRERERESERERGRGRGRGGPSFFLEPRNKRELVFMLSALVPALEYFKSQEPKRVERSSGSSSSSSKGNASG